jgi:hypothetical protein
LQSILRYRLIIYWDRRIRGEHHIRQGRSSCRLKEHINFEPLFTVSKARLRIFAM